MITSPVTTKNNVLQVEGKPENGKTTTHRPMTNNVLSFLIRVIIAYLLRSDNYDKFAFLAFFVC